MGLIKVGVREYARRGFYEETTRTVTYFCTRGAASGVFLGIRVVIRYWKVVLRRFVLILRRFSSPPFVVTAVACFGAFTPFGRETDAFDSNNVRINAPLEHRHHCYSRSNAGFGTFFSQRAYWGH